MTRSVTRICSFHKNLALTLVECKKTMKTILAYEKYAATIPEENFAKYFVESNAKSAPTKFAKCFMKQEGWSGQTTTRSKHARAPVWCKRTTAARSNTIVCNINSKHYY